MQTCFNWMQASKALDNWHNDGIDGAIDLNDD